MKPQGSTIAGIPVTLAMLKESGRGGNGGSEGASVPTISASSLGAALPAGSIRTSQVWNTRRISSIRTVRTRKALM